jgi:hypothetical protein
MFSDSKDILFLTIAICVAAFTVFSCWGLFYIVGGLRNFFKIAQDIRDVFKKIEGTIDEIRSKIGQSASYVFLIGEALKKVMEAAKIYSNNKKDKEEDEDCEDEEDSDNKKSKNKKSKAR